MNRAAMEGRSSGNVRLGRLRNVGLSTSSLQCAPLVCQQNCAQVQRRQAGNEDRIDCHGGGPSHVITMRQGLLMKPETLAQLQENRIEVLMTAIRCQHRAANWPLQSHTRYLRLCTITGDEGAEHCLYACSVEVLSVRGGLMRVLYVCTSMLVFAFSPLLCSA